MSKRSVVTSIAASMVLASVLVLSGCGGSNSDSDKGSDAPGLIPNSKASSDKLDIVFDKPNTKIVADVNGETGDGSGKAATVRCLSAKDEQKKDTCTKKADKCSIKVKMESTSCVKREDADTRYTSNYGITVLNYLDANRDAYNYDPTKDMIVYGGAVLMDVKGFSSGNIKIDIKGMKCGQGINHKDGSAIEGIGFANNGHKVFALVKVHDKNGNQVVADQWAPITNMDESGNFTIDLNGLDLGDGEGNTVEALLLSVKPAVGDKVSGTTGVSGAGS